MKLSFTSFAAGLGAIATLAAATGLIAPSPAFADDQEVRQLKAKDEPDLSQGKAYIVYQTLENKYDIFFLRSLTEDELVQFSENRKVALAEERAELREKRAKKAARDGLSAPEISDEELLPDAAFSYVDPDIRNLVRLDSGRVFLKNGKERTYVVEVPPGEYTVFGAGIDGFTGGTCMCMGSVKFDAKAQEITNLGAILVAGEDGKSALPELAGLEAPEYIRRKTMTYIMSVRPPDPEGSMPSRFQDLPVVPAAYRASDKIPNFLGMIVNRMPAIEGVLRYDRDKVIDVKAQVAAEQKAKAEALAKAQEAAEKARLEAERAAKAKAEAEAQAAAASAQAQSADGAATSETPSDEPVAGPNSPSV